MKNQRGFVSVLIAILIGVVVLGGGAYYVLQQRSILQTASDSSGAVQTLPTKDNQDGLDKPFFKITDMNNGKISFVSQQLGFSLEYPSSRKELTLHTSVGKILVDGSLKSAQATDLYSLYNFVTGNTSLFYVVGSDYESYTDGIPVKRLLEECATQNKDCIKKRNGNNVEYYYFDNYQNLVGELHLALIPLSASTLVISLPRTDSSEVASTMAEEREYFDLIESVRLIK